MTHRRAFIVAILFSVAGCVTTVEKGVEIQPGPDEDGEYREPLVKATRTVSAFDDFETRFQITVTYLSPEFRGALARRYQELYKEPQPILEEATSKAGFFVSLYAPSRELTNLADTHLWKVFMRSSAEESIKPVIIRHLLDKDRWTPFFSSVTPWSSEYLVVFDAPSTTPNAETLVEKSPIQLTFANADATVSLAW